MQAMARCRRKIHVILLAGWGAFFSGCDYITPLTTAPTIEIDQALVGLWQQLPVKTNAPQLLVLPLDKKEYLVVYPNASLEAIFGRACLWRSSDFLLAQIEWRGNARGVLPEDKRVFQFARWELKNDELKVFFLNPEVVPSDLPSAAELAQAISEHKTDANLFRAPLVFQKIR